MHRINYFINIFVIVVCIFLSVDIASADRLDKYRDIIRNKQYTIVYTYSVDVKVDNKEYAGMVSSNGDLNHILVRDSDNAAYTENGTGNDALQCVLFKDGEMYRYFKTKKKDVFKYYGDIEPMGPSSLNLAMKMGMTPILSHLDTIIAIPSKNTIWSIEKVGDSINKQGYYCEDYKVTCYNTPYQAIRFIFDEENLIEVDIAEVGIARRTTIKFSKFTGDVDYSVLELPKEMKIRKVPKELREAQEKAFSMNSQNMGAFGTVSDGTYGAGFRGIIISQ